MNKEIKKFKGYIRENRKIRTKLRYIAGWNSTEFKQIISLLEKGEKENFKHIEELKNESN